MRKSLAILAVLAASFTPLWAPPQHLPPVVVVSSAPTGTCTSNEIRVVKASGAMYSCIGGSWTQLPANAFYGVCSASVASAATITVDNCNLVTITGSVTITTVNTCNTANKGRPLVVLCGTATSQFTDGSNLTLAGNFTCTSSDSLALVCDGTNWVELDRSAN
jgi:hypothetical protein